MTKSDYDKTPKYYAVPDPNTGDMTYWFRNRRGAIVSWPQRPPARYGPRRYHRDGAHVGPYDSFTPLFGSKAEKWDAYAHWKATVREPWEAAIMAAIEGDPELAQSRFAGWRSRCCVCSLPLDDEDSKIWGIGPVCRKGMPGFVLEDLARQMGRIHAEVEKKNAETTE